MSEASSSKSNRLLLVSNRLPVSIERMDTGDLSYHPSVGGLATSLSSLRDQRPMLWLGWPGLTSEVESERTAIEDRLGDEFGCVPIFLPQEDFDRYYTGFSNGTIWPLFHYFTQYAHYEKEDWEAYVRINRLFCEKVRQIIQPGDTLWIHDYHLMLLPGMVREAMPEATIGFFLHIPFPSSEILRMLPWREQILEGLLGADLVGFHSFGYARHFLSSLLRLKGLDQEFGQVLVDGRPVRADTFPLGVDVKRFSGARKHPEVQAQLEELRQQTGVRKVILSVDRLDFTKGILERLDAFDAFLERYPDWQGKVSLISLSVPSRTQVPEYIALKRQVDEMVGRINGRYGRPGWIPIWYLYRSLPFYELVALYAHADVALVTPLRDGMNLVAKEYLAAHPEGDGVLILSETAGSAEELGEALIVNPHNREAILDALLVALEMPQEERARRSGPMLERLRRYDTARWAEDFLGQLEKMGHERPDYQQKLLEGARWRALVEGYGKAERRLLLLDYDGTLMSFVSRAEYAAPDEELLEALRTLADDPRNSVVVVSGRDHSTLENWLAKTGVDMVSEHGARYWRREDGSWRVASDAAEEGWQDQIRPVLQIYVDRTPGAYLEDKGTSLVWHYRTAEPELGALRAMELVNTLESYVANTPLHIMQGNKVVEVKSLGVNKGRAAQRWLNREPGFDFIFAIGDDVTDEDTFSALPDDSWSIKVGADVKSNANYYLPGSEEVRRLLKDLIAEGPGTA